MPDFPSCPVAVSRKWQSDLSVAWAARAHARARGPGAGRARLIRALGPGRLGAVKRHSSFPIKIYFVWGFLYGRAGRLTAENGGFRPGRVVVLRAEHRRQHPHAGLRRYGGEPALGGLPRRRRSAPVGAGAGDAVH